MYSKEDIQAHRASIARGRTEQVLEELANLGVDTPSEIILLNNRIKELNRNKVNGILANEEIELERIRITHSLLLFLEEINLSSKKNDETVLRKSTQSVGGILSILILSMSVLGYLFFNQEGVALKVGMYLLMLFGFSMLCFNLIKSTNSVQ